MQKCDDAALSSSAFSPTYQAALKADAVRSGWIPGFVPEEAYEIIEWLSLSPADQTLRFTFSDPKAFKRKLYAYKKLDEKLGKLRPKKISKDQARGLPKAIAFEPTDFYPMADFYQTACRMTD